MRCRTRIASFWVGIALLSVLRWASAQEPTATLRHSGSVPSAAFSSDGNLLATASTDGTAKLWHAETGELIASFDHKDAKVGVVKFSPDGSMLMTGAENGNINLWNPKTSELIKSVSQKDKIWCAAFSPDSKLLVTGSRDNTGILWKVPEGTHLFNLNHTGDIRSVAFSPDGATVVTAGEDNMTRLWNAKTGKIKMTLVHARPVVAVAFSPDGSVVATGSSDRTARIWNPATGKTIHSLSHENYVLAVAFSPNGFLLATGSEDGAARLWDVSSGKLLSTFQYSAAVTSVAFSPDSLILATGSRDDSVTLWDTKGEQLLATFPHNGDILSVVFNPNGRGLVTTSEDGSAKLWSFLPPHVRPNLIAPENSAALSLTPPLQWQPIPGAWQYAVQIADDPTFFSLIVDDYAGKEEFLIPSGKLGNGQFYWRTSPSTLRDSLGPWSPTFTFTLSAKNVVKANVVQVNQETATVELLGQGMEGLSGFQATIGYDTSVLEIADAQEGDFLKRPGGQVIWQPPVIDKRLGTVTLLQFRIGSETVSGDGLLATLRFKVLRRGSGVVQFNRLKLSDAQSNPIRGVPVEDVVVVSGPATLTLVVTPQVVDNQLVVEVSVQDAFNIGTYELKIPYLTQALELLEGEASLSGRGTPARGVLTRLRFRIWDGAEAVFRPTGVIRSPEQEEGKIQIAEGQITLVASPPEDLDKDYKVDSADLVILARSFDRKVSGSPRPNPDVNRDGLVDLFDFVRVATAFGEQYSAVPAAPAFARNYREHPIISPAVAREYRTLWATLLGRLDLLPRSGVEDEKARTLLSRLLSLSGDPVERTTVFQNFPNPFNPETWIPFELKESADVTVRIFDAAGNLVRSLELGRREAGSYTGRLDAAYWDGKNESGEFVSSGLYAYELRAGDYRASRRMLILK